jgi:hypothetical protein
MTGSTSIAIRSGGEAGTTFEDVYKAGVAASRTSPRCSG